MVSKDSMADTNIAMPGGWDGSIRSSYDARRSQRVAKRMAMKKMEPEGEQPAPFNFDSKHHNMQGEHLRKTIDER